MLLKGLDPSPAAVQVQAQLDLLAPPASAPPWDGDPGSVRALVERLLGSRNDLADRDGLDRLLGASLDLIRGAGRALGAAGAFTAGSGSVAGLFTSGGGVPKAPVDRVRFGVGGVAGDRQAHRAHHGRPWQAVCLWSAEVLELLRAEGHPIGAGSAGENVSVSGLDWTSVRPGCRLYLRDDVLLEVSLPAVPCRANARWFRDGDFNRIHPEHEAGIARQYAWVLSTGEVTTGDAVALLP